MIFYSQTFRIRIGETDGRQRLTVPALAGLLQESAWEHTVTRQLDVPRLLQHGLSWVLSRMRIEVGMLPVFGQTIQLDTWVSAIDRYFYYREFCLTDTVSQQILLRATSVWGVFDVEKRRVIPIPDFIRDRTAVHTETPALAPATGKLPPVVEPLFSQSFTVVWHDLDANRHVNNTRYFQWLLDAFPADWLDHHRIQLLDVVFRGEAALGETITAQIAPGGVPSGGVPSENSTSFLHHIRTDDGRVLAQARSIWV